MGLYFEKYRPLAFGLGMAGGGFANIVFPWITFSLIDTYSWRGIILAKCCGFKQLMHSCPTKPVMTMNYYVALLCLSLQTYKSTPV